jgi:hypothetical protein
MTYRDKTLQGNQGRLEVGANTNTGNGLVDDDLGPGRVGSEIDKEASTDGHQCHAEPDGGQVLPSLADDDAGENGENGQCNGGGKEVDAGEDGRGAQYSLEVERQEVVGGNEDKGVAEAGSERGNVGALREDGERHQRVRCQSRFDHEEQADNHHSEDDETDDDWRIPRVGYAAEFEAKQDHDGAADHCQGSQPVDSLQAVPQGRLWRVDIKEKEQDDKGDAVEGEVDIETPPRQLVRYMRSEVITNLQLTFCVNSPPMMGPRLLASAQTPPMIPK